jgi:hypothetical protein
LNDGVDERYCFELEINECNDDEYRCHNGICIPAKFVNDHPDNPDCSDGTDENDSEFQKFARNSGFLNCYLDPTFLCEESDNHFGQRGFVCGDGQQIKLVFKGDVQYMTRPSQTYCSNHRDSAWVVPALSDISIFSHLKNLCKILAIALSLGNNCVDWITAMCAGQDLPCRIQTKDVCEKSDYILIPLLPYMQNYAHFGYWTNKSLIYESLDLIPRPDFVCFNQQRCPLALSIRQIDNRTCADFPDMDIYSFISLFHMCLTYDEIVNNETHCFDASLLHCPNTSKCISKHRLVDGVYDCPGGIDEKYHSSCELNNRFRFRCTRNNKCLSPVMIRNFLFDCDNGEDESSASMEKLPFQDFCDGYTHLSSTVTHEQNETDETHCEEWPCVNLYTKCNKAWTCPNGADEIGCDPDSKCNSDSHECVSPIDFKMICLPMNRSGDGKVDCLGSTDERDHCRRNPTQAAPLRYRCWNSTTCVFAGCDSIQECVFER